MLLADTFHRLRALLRRGTVDREIEAELQFHLEREIEKRIAAGVARDEAQRQARLTLGGVEQIKEAHRDARGIAFIDTIVQDLRYGIRSMTRSPLFSLTAVATIALSSAAIATVLTLGYTLFYRRLPIERPDEVVHVAATRIRSSTSALTPAEAARLQTLGPVSHLDFLAIRGRTHTLSALAAHYSTAPLFVNVGGEAREINGAVVSANFFPLIGLQPVLGRFFSEDEDRLPDRDRVAVISSNMWRARFAGSPAAIGSHVTINGTDFVVIGVAPGKFVGMTPIPIEIYIPTAMLRVGYRWCDDALAADCNVLQMIGRLAPGQSAATAAAELATLVPASWRHARPGENSGIAVTEPRGMSEDDDEPRLVRLLVAAAVVLLLVCCANLGGLVGAQTAARAREFAVRCALGASGRRIVRQVATESLVLAAGGAVAGVLLSRTFLAALAVMFFSTDDEGHPLYYDLSQTPSIVAATLGLALVAGLLFSIMPALAAARQRTLAGASPRSTTFRSSAGMWLLAAQAAVAVAMLTVSALLASSARTVLTGRNYDGSRVALMRVRPRLVKYSPERAQRFQRELVAALQATPGVEAVSMVGVGAVLSGGRENVALPEWTGGEQVRTGYNEIGPRYFATLATPLRSGREFDEHDSTESPRVAIVNVTLADRLWPKGGALGGAVLLHGTPYQVVGVVEDVSVRSRAAVAEPWIYTPFWQNPAEVDSRLAIRVAGDPASMLPALVRVANGVDAAVPIAETITLRTRLAGLLRPVRVGATFVGYTAALAVMLTAIGLYGALAFAVSRRTKEIGIRMALGAAPGRIVASVVGEGLLVVVAGAAAGIGLAAAGVRLFRHLLYGSATTDWMAFALAALVVMIVGALAAVTPARRAASIEPLVALRCD
jgi:predicted permease